jgi:phosphate acetyltransferase
LDFLKKIKKKANKNPKRIVYPESTEPRTLCAIEKIVKLGYAKPILLGSLKNITFAMKKVGVNFAYVLKKIDVIDYLAESNQISFKYYISELCKIRRKKGVTRKIAADLLKDPMYYATMMVRLNDADAMISGAAHTTAETIRPALQIIKTKKRFHRVSGLFLMELKDKMYLFADCAVNISPDSTVLAEIAIDSWHTARELGVKPKIAMLSFSTKGSADHPDLRKIKDAVKKVKRKRPDIIIDGELQVDSAIVPSVSKLKCPGSNLGGKANVLIFPYLSVGNIAYKLVERLAHAEAIGPILQGLSKPINDLSRGCTVNEIVDISAVTTVQVQDLEKEAKLKSKKIKSKLKLKSKIN